MSQQKPKSPSPNAQPESDAPLEQSGAEALARVRARLDALDPEHLITPHTNARHAVTVGLASAPRLKKLLPEILAELPKFDRSNVDELDTFALALFGADEQVTTAEIEYRKDVESLAHTVDLWTALAPILVSERDVDPRILKVERDRSMLGTAGNANKIGTIILNEWSKCEGSVPFTRSAVEQALRAATRVLKKLSERENETDTPEADTRRRAWTLFYNAYEECRRAATTVRWYKRDVAKWTPSLFAYDAPKKRSADDDAPDAQADDPGGDDGNTTTVDSTRKEIRVGSPGGVEAKATKDAPMPLPLASEGRPVKGDGNGEPI